MKCEFEKYRTISEITDMSEEEIDTVVSMQAIQETLLSFQYQFSMGTESQMGMWEIMYTIAVTAVSTAISMGLSSCFGTAAHNVIQASQVSKQALNYPVMLTSMAQSSSISGFKIVGAVVGEIGQELMLDPWIESMVTGITAEMGWSAEWQIICSTLAESMREAITGPISQLLGLQSNTQNMVSEIRTLKQSGKTITGADILSAWNEMQAQAIVDAEEETPFQKYGGLLLSTLGALTLISVGMGMFASTLISCTISASVQVIIEARSSHQSVSIKDIYRELREVSSRNVIGTPEVVQKQTSQLLDEYKQEMNEYSGMTFYDGGVPDDSYLRNPTYLRAVRLFDMIKAVIMSEVQGTQKEISQNLGVKRLLGEYRSLAKKQILRYASKEYYISADYLDTMEFNILSNPFFDGLKNWKKNAVVRVIDNYRSWVDSLDTDRTQLVWRYRVHRTRYSSLDIAIRKKMWLFRELRAAYTRSGGKIINVKDLGVELFGVLAQTGSPVLNRFYDIEKTNNHYDLSIQSYLIALSSVMMSRTIVDRKRALNALYDYGKVVFDFDLKNPNHLVLFLLINTFRDEPSIGGVFSEDLLSLTYIASLIADCLQDSFSGKTLTNKLENQFMFYEGTIDKIKIAIDRLISDSSVKAYTLAYLEHYRQNYAVGRDYRFDRTFQLSANFRSVVSVRALSDYLSYLPSIEGNVKKLPDSVLSQHDKDTGIRVSSFNNKLTYVLSDVKAKFISKMMGSKIQVFSPGQAPSKLAFINDLMSFSHSKLYDKSYILGHKSPAHEVVLPNLVKNRDWAVACEVPVYLKPDNAKLEALLGHIDLLVIYDGVIYVCDYKPDQGSKATPYKSFINSIPQIATYALVIKRTFGLKDVKCVTFNKKGAWLYDPLASLTEITKFMLRERDPSSIPWLDYLRELNK